MLYEVIKNPSLSLTTDEMVDVGKWLDIMNWNGLKVDKAEAKAMVKHIVTKDHRLEFFVIVCPLPTPEGV